MVSSKSNLKESSIMNLKMTYESVYVKDGYWSLVITSLIIANTLRRSIKNNVYAKGHLT